MEPPDIRSNYLGPYGDEFYALLMKAHEGLSETESNELNIRLVLIMANQIGDIKTLQHVIETATMQQE